jgi:hypothetical protein
VGEFVPGSETSTSAKPWRPKNTPAEIVNKLNKEINAGLADPRQIGRRVGPSSDMIGTSTCN